MQKKTKKQKTKVVPGIKQFKLSELKPAEYNPRVIGKDALAGLTNSIERFGCVEPIVVNTRDCKNTIIGGHQRLRALKRLKIKEVVCVTVNCSKEDEKLLNLTLNNPHIQGEFIEGIAGYIDKLRKGLSDKSDYLDLRIAELRGELEEEKAGLVPDDEIPKPPKKAITKPGDLWILGKHRLLCGDATKEKDIKRLMGGHKLDMIFTDPPYGINLDTDFSSMVGIGKGKKYDKMKGDNVDFDPNFIFERFRCTEIFLFGAEYYAERIPNRNKGSWICWDKSFEGCNDDYDKMFGSNFELCWSKVKHKRGIARILWKAFFGLGKEDLKKREHPTQKPVALAEWFIEKFSKNNNIICDLYIGVGWTLIACEKLERICFAMEIEPIYCDVAVKRWEQWTGKKARRIKIK